MAMMVVVLDLFRKASLLWRETSITQGIASALAAAALILVPLLTCRQFLRRYPAFKILALEKYAERSIKEITLFRQLRHILSGPNTIQIAYDNVGRLKVDCFNHEK